MGDILHNGNWNAGSVSLDCIEENLFLGSLSAALDVPTLTKYKITHILTIDTCPLPRNILELKFLSTKFIQLTDTPKADLLSHFNDTNEFIEHALENNGVVLVHCYYGVSRSATVIIAYVMKKYKLGYREAFEKVKTKRSIVFPNQGFVNQLKMYKDMDFSINRDHIKFKVFRLSMAADKVRKIKILPQEFFDLIKADPGLTRIQPEPNVYRCKKCRRVLASESNLMTHSDRKSKDNVICKHMYFLEPLSWMANVTQKVDGKLHCPQCNNKIGCYSWIMGCECPCGCQVAPAFYIVPSKVDFTNVVKNVEVTI